MWGFEVDDMCDAWHVDPRPKSSCSHDVWAFTPESSLETDLSLSEEVSIAILGVPIVIVAT
jgi:hypothetical protein